MWPYLRRITLFLALILFGASAKGDSGALIVVGLSGDITIATDYHDLAERTANALEQRGIPVANIQLLTDKVSREDLLDAINANLAKTKAGDEYWIVLLGHGGAGRNDEPQFQLRGPRLNAKDLQDALLKHETAAPILVLGFDRSGGFLTQLDKLPATTISATANASERNLPRFTGFFVDELENAPQADVKLLAARAAEATKVFYESQSLARTEESRLYDPTIGKTLQPPFGVTDLHEERPATTAPQDVFQGMLLASEIEIPKTNSNELFTDVPATNETRALIAEAQAQPNPEGFAGLLLRRDIDLAVTPSNNATQRERFRVYLIDASSFDEWANYNFPMNPPTQMTRIEAARLILPDGRSRVLGKANTTTDAPDLQPMNHLFFTGVEIGSIIEIETVTETKARTDLPEYYDEIRLQSSLPTLFSEIKLHLPKLENYNYYLANSDAEPTAADDDFGRSYTWKLTDLPAYEPLPYDPPAREWTIWLGISSIGSWENFTDWFRRISAGAFDASPEVIALAEQIAAANPDREARIREAYEYVGGMRYIAIEIGVQAFRPRTPGQVLAQGYGDCKDKANLLSALLREMDIPAHIALINRFSYTETEFPGWQFNHAIAYLAPDAENPDGRWLDSTETTTLYGELAPGDAGRKALVIDKAGAGEFKLVDASPLQLSENWEITGGDPAGYFANYSRPVDNHLQRSLATSSPQRRDLLLRQLVQPLYPNAQISKLTADAKGVTAELLLNGLTAPTLGLPIDDAFLAPSRDRPLQLFGGKTAVYQQTVSFPLGQEERFPDREDYLYEDDFLALRITWDDLGPRGLQRTATFELRQPNLPSESYDAAREAYQDWRRQLDNPTHPLTFAP